MVQASIMFATFKRGDLLRKTLDGFANLDPCSIEYEIIVVDNACEQQVENIVRSYEKRLPISYFAEAKPGKNAALISGLQHAKGEILVFTDDDVIVQPDWLNKLLDGINRLPEYDLFTGKILPHVPEGIDDKYGLLQCDTSFIKSAYVIANWELPEGAIRPGHIWGSNMAVRRRVLAAGISFDPTIGPNGSNYMMGSDTEFSNRAAAQGFKCAFIPDAIVYHQIRQEQLTLSWLAGRAFRWGRGEVRRRPIKSRLMIFGAPFYLYRRYLLDYFIYIYAIFLSRSKSVEKLIAFNITKGVLYKLIADWKGKNEKTSNIL